jgi:hypothetical protein
MREPLALSVIPELRVSAISGTQGQRMAGVELVALGPGSRVMPKACFHLRSAGMTTLRWPG